MRDYENVVLDLRERASSYEQMFGEGESSIVMKDAADAIEELVAAVPQWISVEERLPHYLDHVLCVNKFGIQMVGHLTDYKEGGFRCESGMDSCDYITHWMPLPSVEGLNEA